VDNQVLRAVILTAGKVAVQNVLGTVGVADLSIDGSTGHVGNHGVTAAPGVLGVAERVVLRSGLGEPDITTVSAEVAGLKGLGNILLDDNSTASGVDEPSTGLHLGDEFFVEETASLLVEGAVNGNDVTLGEHLLEVIDATTANLLLGFGGEGLVVVVEELLAVERLEAAEDTLTDTADGDGTDDLALEVELVLSDGGNIPVTVLDLLVGGHEVADEEKDSHHDVLSDRNDVGASDLGDSDTTVSGIGGVQVNVVRANTGSDGKLELLGLGQTLSGQVTGVEGSGDDDFSVDELLVEGGVLALLVGGGHQGVTLVLKPLADAKLVLSGTEQLRLLLGVLTTLYHGLVVGYIKNNLGQLTS
jgi:hypothetical protein